MSGVGQIQNHFFFVPLHPSYPVKSSSSLPSSSSWTETITTPSLFLSTSIATIIFLPSSLPLSTVTTTLVPLDCRHHHLWVSLGRTAAPSLGFTSISHRHPSSRLSLIDRAAPPSLSFSPASGQLQHDHLSSQFPVLICCSCWDRGTEGRCWWPGVKGRGRTITAAALLELWKLCLPLSSFQAQGSSSFSCFGSCLQNHTCK